MDTSKTGDLISASVTRGAKTSEDMMVQGHYTMTCIGPDGKIKWEDEFDNLVTTQGKNYLLDQGIPNGNGSGDRTNVKVWTAMSLMSAGSPSATWNYGTPGYTEVTGSVIAARLGVNFNTVASGGVKTAQAVSFNIIGSGTVTGAALNLLVGASAGSLLTIGNTAEAGAVLYSAGTFTSKTVSSGDTLQVTYSTTLT